MDEQLTLLAGFGLSVIFGALIAWLICRSRTAFYKKQA